MKLPDGVHFKFSDFACHDGTPYPEDFVEQWTGLIGICDAIREQWGAPLTVVSGYRTPRYNSDLVAADEERGTHQVASGSYHIIGQAADLRPETVAQVPQLLKLVLSMKQAGELPLLGGVASYPVSAWVHIDTGLTPDGHLRRWTGR